MHCKCRDDEIMMLGMQGNAWLWLSAIPNTLSLDGGGGVEATVSSLLFSGRPIQKL